MQFRDFDAEQSAAPKGEPIEFKLGGVRFRCVDPAPVGSLLTLAQHADGRNPFGQVKAMATFLRAWVVPEQRDAWDEAICYVTDPTVIERLVDWLVESATARPTTPPSNSPGSPATDGGNSTAAAPSPGLTPWPSPLPVS